MPVSARIRDLVAKSQSEDSAVSWPAMRLLGLLAEGHFAETVAALEGGLESGRAPGGASWRGMPSRMNLAAAPAKSLGSMMGI